MVVTVVQFLSGIVSLAKMDGFIPFLQQLFSFHFHLTHFRASFLFDQSFQSPIQLVSFRSSLVDPRFLLPLTLKSCITLKTPSSSLVSTCPYHQIPFAVANSSTIFFDFHLHLTHKTPFHFHKKRLSEVDFACNGCCRFLDELPLKSLYYLFYLFFQAGY